MYSLRKLNHLHEGKKGDTHFQVLMDGIKPVAILTNKYAEPELKGDEYGQWHLILLKNNIIHDVFLSALLSPQEAINHLNKMLEGNSLKGLGSNPNCILRYVTEFGMSMYQSSSLAFSMDKKVAEVFPKNESAKRLKSAKTDDVLPLEGDRVSEIQVVVISTGDVIRTKKVKPPKGAIIFNEAPDIWPETTKTPLANSR